MPKTTMEKLSTLYALVDECQRCHLGKENASPRLRFKFGTQPILLVGQNPGCRVVPGCNHIWGGLDILRKRTHNSRRLRYLDEVLDAVWITNVVKCRKERDRPLDDDETTACLPWLLNEIDYIHPKRIIALGEPAHRWLSCNGKDHIQVYHPGYVVRGRVPVEDYIDSLYFQVFAT